MRHAPFVAAVAIATLAGGEEMASGQAFSLGELYVKSFGGATWPSSFDSALTEDGTQIALPSFDHDTGYTLGVAVGAAVTPNISMEIEYAYRNADFTVTDRDEGDRTDGDTSANAFMFNALYMFDGMGASGAMRPYLGGGIGGANVEMSAGGQDFDSETLFAYQLIGGVSYELNPNVSLYAEGRWFETESGKFDGPDEESFDGKFETFDLLVGMSYAF
ncbi:outer membrane protein [Paracoccus litorisediminis]|uniref:Outer membrane beta-barrel protein n=1 Tax=Paracoccus litorisediminis TaxID=2006130 RepID=A0A844HW88_9RHOB|nr:outer membrane beta-barrel protein [Paracoccus litorisediminis]MTH61732.1 outer membrane beta-barrel protein [Paracoccus litorisediminis]